MGIAITLTTIHKPTLLEDYIRNIQQYGHEDIEIVVVGDKKTPSGMSEYCQRLSFAYLGVKSVTYLGIEEQTKFLMQGYKDLFEFLPYNSFARRNIGDLYAYDQGHDIIIRVDDDNFPMETDFIGGHKVHGQTDMLVVDTSTGWYNICEELTDKSNIPFYPRGFPYDMRWQTSNVYKKWKSINVVLNGGLWLGDPDVDAVTRLCKPIDAVEYKRTFGAYFALEKGTWCPINTQNTSYSRQIIPASYVSPNVGRYDDIWSGYLLRKITDTLGDYVSYGEPLLNQIRNEHNLWDDLDKEINGNLYTRHLIDTMDDIDLKGTSYADCYYELAEKLDQNLHRNRDVFDNVITGMKIWAECFR